VRSRFHDLAEVRDLPAFDYRTLFDALDAQRQDWGLDRNGLAKVFWQQSSDLHSQLKIIRRARPALAISRG
jgi:hypothetical protein